MTFPDDWLFSGEILETENGYPNEFPNVFYVIFIFIVSEMKHHF